MKKKTRLSYSSVSTYLECGEKYRLTAIEKLRPVKAKSALLFGVAIDEALNELLLTRDVEKAKVTFMNHWTTGKINYQPVDLQSSDLVVYSKSDFDPDIAPTPWECLKTKGLLFIDEYNKQVMPKIKEVIVVQKTNEIENTDGDKIIVKLDLIVRWEDDKIYLLDNKTTSVAYDEKSAEEAAQLLLYYYVEKEQYKLDGVGYIVINKHLKKTKEKKCAACNITVNDNRTKNCPGCKKKLEHTNTAFDVEINYYLNSNPQEKFVDNVLADFDHANAGISNEIFEKNEKACWGKFGKCEVYDYCKKRSMDGLVSLKKDEK